jgi:hypothetical protein
VALTHVRGWDPAVFGESPWYGWLEPALSEVAGQPGFPGPERWTELHAACAAEAGVAPLCFVASPAKKPRRRARQRPIQLASLYEGRIVERGEVPTRLDDWHDFFNALAFLCFPRAKWALHTRQHRIMQGRLGPEARRLPGARTREQDALALFDEGGIAVAVEPALAAEQPEQPDAFAAWLCERVAQGAALPVPFGHALFEHLVAGHTDTLGTVQVLPVAGTRAKGAALRAAVDQALASALSDPGQFVAPSQARGVSLARLSALNTRLPFG